MSGLVDRSLWTYWRERAEAAERERDTLQAALREFNADGALVARAQRLQYWRSRFAALVSPEGEA